MAGHPNFSKAAVFDIISPDLELGPIAAGGELISVANHCLDNFPTLSQSHDIHISHSKRQSPNLHFVIALLTCRTLVVEIVMNRIPSDARDGVIETIQLPKSTPAQKRALLTKKNLLRTTIDEVELLSEVCKYLNMLYFPFLRLSASVVKDIDEVMSRLEKISPGLAALISPAISEISNTIQFAQSAGVTRPIYFHPLMLGTHHTHFKEGVLVEVVRRNKHADVLAAGGR